MSARPKMTRGPKRRILELLVALLALFFLFNARAKSEPKGRGRYSYEWPRPRLAVDPVVVLEPSAEHPKASVLLVKRKNPPFQGYWGVPGGYVNEHERMTDAAVREVKEETSVDLKDREIHQVAVFDDPDRDARGGWCVGVTYAALLPVSASELKLKGGDDAAEAKWHDVLDLPLLAFDHKQVIRAALRHLAGSERAKAVEGLSAQLAEAADKLEGPWEHKEEHT